MKRTHSRYMQILTYFFTAIIFFSVSAGITAVAGEYDNALKGVKGIKAVFDYSQGSPKLSNIIFGAVKGAYEDGAANGLSEEPQFVILFQGPAIKLITTDRSNFAEKDFGELDKFHAMIRELNKAGVRFEVCLYAANVVGVDPSTILPEIDQVGNGFISTIGYQAQGYSLVRVP